MMIYLRLFYLDVEFIYRFYILIMLIGYLFIINKGDILIHFIVLIHKFTGFSFRLVALLELKLEGFFRYRFT